MSKFKPGQKIYYKHTPVFGEAEIIAGVFKSIGLEGRVWAYWGDNHHATWVHIGDVFTDKPVINDPEYEGLFI